MKNGIAVSAIPGLIIAILLVTGYFLLRSSMEAVPPPPPDLLQPFVANYPVHGYRSRNDHSVTFDKFGRQISSDSGWVEVWSYQLTLSPTSDTKIAGLKPFSQVLVTTAKVEKNGKSYRFWSIWSPAQPRPDQALSSAGYDIQARQNFIVYFSNAYNNPDYHNWKYELTDFLNTWCHQDDIVCLTTK